MKIILSTLFIFCIVIGKAQIKSDSLRFLKVGDTIPDIILKDLRNGDSQIHLSGYKGKYLLLDFWATYCSACIAGFPKMDAIQAKHKDKLQIVLINASQDEQTINKFFSRWKKVTGYNINHLPFTKGDSSLNKIFFHEGLPLYVLIDPKGIIKAFPAYDQIDDEDIQLTIESGSFKNMDKKPFKRLDNFNAKKPLFINHNAGDGKEIIWYSVLSKRVEGLPAGQYFNPDDGNEKSIFYAYNMDIKDLFQIIFYDGFRTNKDFANVHSSVEQNAWIPNSRTVLDMTDTTKYVPKVNGKYLNDNQFCYQLIGPALDYKSFQKKLKIDAQNRFDVTAKLKQDYRECVVLRCMDTSYCHASGKEKNIAESYSKIGVNWANAPFKDFIFDLSYSSYYSSPYPIIDETGIKGNVTMKFDADMSNWKSLSAAMAKYKIDVTLERRKVNILIISDKK